jgi:adenosine kinase
MNSSLAVSGSIAFDEILKYSGQFKDHILGSNIDVLSLSFLIDSYERHFGGTAGNISYSLGLLGCDVDVVGTCGNGFDAYREHLTKCGVSLKYLKEIPSESTARSITISDRAGSQITGFYVGAMKYSAQIELGDYRPQMMIISPDTPQTMIARTAWARENGVPFIADIGQQVIDFGADDLISLIDGAELLILNEYEFEIVKKSLEGKQILDYTSQVIVTLGENGSVLKSKQSPDIEIPSIEHVSVLDPTGAGDGYRAGILYAMISDLSITDGMKIGTYIASKVIENPGTQNHSLDMISQDLDHLYSLTLPLIRTTQ